MTETTTATLPSRGSVGPRKVARPKATVITYENRHLLRDLKVDSVIKPMTRSQMSISLNGNPVQLEFTAYSKFGASLFDGKEKKFTPSLSVAFPIERNPEIKEIEDIIIEAVEKQLVMHWDKLWKPEVPKERRLERVREDYLQRMSRSSKTDKGKTFGANYRAKITDKTKLFTDESDVPIPEAAFKKKVEGMYTVLQDLAYVDVTQPASVFIMCYTNRLLLHVEADDDDTAPFQTVKFRNTAANSKSPSSPNSDHDKNNSGHSGKKRKSTDHGENPSSPTSSSSSSSNKKHKNYSEGESSPNSNSNSSLNSNSNSNNEGESEGQLKLNSSLLGNPTPLVGLDD